MSTTPPTPDLGAILTALGIKVPGAPAADPQEAVRAKLKADLANALEASRQVAETTGKMREAFIENGFTPEGAEQMVVTMMGKGASLPPTKA